MKYPEIYYPYFYQEIAESKPELKKPSEPRKPAIPLKPEKTQEHTGCLFVPVILIILSFFISDHLDFKLIAGFIFLSLISVFMYKTGKWDNQSFHKKNEDFEREKKDYPKKMEQYEYQFLKYQEEVNQYNLDVRRSLKKNNLRKYRNNNYSQFHKGEALEFEFCNDEDDDILSGISEKFFYNYLMQFEELTIYRNAKIEVGDKFYYPDFIAVVYSHEFYIDIEIDEPYEADGGLPIHFYRIDEYGNELSKDFNRNEYFTDCGWFVLRFAEEQIVRAPEECLDFIRKFVKEIKSFSLKEPRMEFELDKWDEIEAERLALEGHRLNYLSEIR